MHFRLHNNLKLIRSAFDSAIEVIVYGIRFSSPWVESWSINYKLLNSE
jgi:hypothetical protein